MYELASLLKRKISNLLLDLRYGSILRGVKRSPHASLGAHDTTNSDYAVLSHVFASRIAHSDVLVDVGCGKGRVINWWLSRGLRNRIIGIELDAEVARQTKERLKRYPSVSIISGNIVEYLPPEGTLFYLYNPFDASVMREFKEQLDQLLERNGGKAIRIIYYNCLYLEPFARDSRCTIERGEFLRPFAIITMDPPIGSGSGDAPFGDSNPMPRPLGSYPGGAAEHPHDCSLPELKPDWVRMLEEHRSEWFCSAQFSRLYAVDGAQRVWLGFHNDGSLSRACYYLEDRFAGLLKRVMVFGPVPLGLEEIHEIIYTRGAHLATVTRASEQDARRIRGPFYRCVAVAASDDTIIELPGSSGEYVETLGRQTKKHLPYYLRRLRRERSGDFQWTRASAADISLELFSALVALNRRRIENKGSRSLWNDKMVRQRWRLAQETGLLVGLQLQGELVGGTLCYLHNHEAYLALIGHDPAYDRLNIGSICLWQTIEYLIELKVARFHLLWGASFYKRQFGGETESLFEITVFRSPLVALVWHAVRVVQAAGARVRRVLGPMRRRLLSEWKRRKLKAAKTQVL